jgi:hypothetical protein
MRSTYVINICLLVSNFFLFSICLFTWNYQFVILKPSAYYLAKRKLLLNSQYLSKFNAKLSGRSKSHNLNGHLCSLVC